MRYHISNWMKVFQALVIIVYYVGAILFSKQQAILNETSLFSSLLKNRFEKVDNRLPSTKKNSEELLSLLYTYSSPMSSNVTIELDEGVKNPIPSEYSLDGYEAIQNQLFRTYSSPFDYKQCESCSYSVPKYGHPFSIVLKPYINSIPNNTLIMICSRPSDTYLRNVFRNNTRSLRKAYNITYFFTLTSDMPNEVSSLQSEQLLYHDLLVFNHTNSYHNLILTVLFSFHYLQNLHLSSRYIVKTDVDCALNLPRLMSVLYSKRIRAMPIVYGGDCFFNERYVFNPDPSSKHYVPAELVSSNTMVESFARGGLYVITTNMITPMLSAVRHLSFITHQEDVTVGRAMSLIGVQCQRLVRHFWLARYGCHPLLCNKYAMVHPKVSSNETPLYYQSFKKKSFLRI